jgi:sec-independent protein translocase protein TatB
VFNLQGSEIIVILLLALVVLGPEKLPEAVRKFTQTYAELKKMSSGFQSELKSALDEPMREIRETANLVRDAADPRKFLAEAEAEQRVLHDADTVAAPPGDWAAPSTDAASTDPPFAGVSDPGHDDVATPGHGPRLAPPDSAPVDTDPPAPTAP